MEFDVELAFDKEYELAVQDLVQRISTATLGTRGKDGTIYVRTDSSEQKDSNLETVLNNFLGPFASHRSSLSALNATVRVGAFFATKDYAFVPVRLSRTLLDVLDDFRLSLSINYYPCSDDEEE
ncbi:hypothetical protein ACV229_35865 [Burkholderia sp. MR1-5-21]